MFYTVTYEMCGDRKEGFVTVNGVSTHVCTWGGWIEDQAEFKEIIVFIPGVPGIIGYYDKFLSKLHSLLNVPVWGISYAGHMIPPATEKPGLPTLNKHPHLYDLKGQVDHKIDFITKYVPENGKITLIAHSIGSKMAIDALQNSSVRRKVEKVYLLFPVIERLAEAPNGNSFWVKYQPIYMAVMILLFSILYFFPSKVREAYMNFLLKRKNYPQDMLEPTLQYVNPVVLSNLNYLGIDAMKNVRQLDHRLIKDLSELLFLYYGENDGWVPLKYWREMGENHPEIQTMVCKNGMKHSFSKRNGEKMALILTDIIEKQRK